MPNVWEYSILIKQFNEQLQFCIVILWKFHLLTVFWSKFCPCIYLWSIHNVVSVVSWSSHKGSESIDTNSLRCWKNLKCLNNWIHLQFTNIDWSIWGTAQYLQYFICHLHHSHSSSDALFALVHQHHYSSLPFNGYSISFMMVKIG